MATNTKFIGPPTNIQRGSVLQESEHRQYILSSEFSVPSFNLRSPSPHCRTCPSRSFTQQGGSCCLTSSQEMDLRGAAGVGSSSQAASCFSL